MYFYMYCTLFISHLDFDVAKLLGWGEGNYNFFIGLSLRLLTKVQFHMNEIVCYCQSRYTHTHASLHAHTHTKQRNKKIIIKRENNSTK